MHDFVPCNGHLDVCIKLTRTSTKSVCMEIDLLATLCSHVHVDE